MAEHDLLRVTRIRVENLFERYSHDISLHLGERVTIIHGPNGVGKTVLLRLTSALLAGKLAEFAKVPFTTFQVSLSDGSTYGVRKVGAQSASKPSHAASFYLRSIDGTEEHFEVKADGNEILTLAVRLERETPFFMRVAPDLFVDRRTDETFDALGFVSKYSEYLPERLRSRGMFAVPDWMKAIQNRVGVHLIEAQRLLRFAPDREWDSPVYRSASHARWVETVKDYAEDLQRRISETLTSYAKVSQSLDQSFPERLLKSSNRTGLTIEALKSRMQELEEKRQQLKRIGLIDADAAYPFDVSALEKTDDSQRSVMTLYVNDTAQKLGVLDDLARRIELLDENINQKFQHKTIKISKDSGFSAITAEGKSLELASLSSGEQHELVLLYDLLFRVKSNTLVLVDEPELSLHVNWQKSFLPDLLEIVAATQFDVLLATHSPFIVGDRFDLMTPLLADAKSREQDTD